MVMQSQKHACGTLVIRCNSSNAQVQRNKSGEEQPLQDAAWEPAYQGAAASTEVPMTGCFRTSPGTSKANSIQIVHICRRTARRKSFHGMLRCAASDTQHAIAARRISQSLCLSSTA